MSPRLLPLLPLGPHGSRSAMTCTYRCGNACDHPEPNRSGNPHIQETLGRAVARRSVLGGAAAGSAALVFGGLHPSTAAAATGERRAVEELTFQPVPPNKRDNVTVPVGYDYDVLIGWGDPVEAGAPDFDVYQQTVEAQSKQFGYNVDYLALLRVPGSRGHFLLVANHEYTNEPLMFPTEHYSPNDIREIAMMAHGMSVVEIKRGTQPGTYERVPVDRAPLNRRITASTPFAVQGPAAGHPKMRTSADPTGRRVLGTLNNCAGGHTPWGTVLSGEENFNQYFEASGDIVPGYAETYERYGVGEESDAPRGWHKADPRFDLSLEPNEPYRFGWIVEIDPMDPTSTPVKHTMLGRLKHECANITLAPSGRVVAYTGDDERGEYLYKFVSRKKYRDSDSPAAKRHNMTLLDSGTLYVGKFRDEENDPRRPEYDGVVHWVPLTSDTESFVDGMSVSQVLMDTRFAADAVGATRMDRPEDVQVNPVNERVYCTLTNNTDRGVEYPPNEANPLGSSHIRERLHGPLVRAPGNNNGYVLEIVPRNGNHAKDRADWVLMLVCGDPDAPETYFAGYPKDQVSPISCPDNVAFDPDGNLWIATDGNALGSNDGLFAVPVRGSQRGHVKQFLTVPVGAETCGPLITRDGKSVFTAVQHPGELDDVMSFEDPASTWPHRTRYPIPSVTVTRRVDGGRIGR